MGCFEMKISFLKWVGLSVGLVGFLACHSDPMQNEINTTNVNCENVFPYNEKEISRWISGDLPKTLYLLLPQSCKMGVELGGHAFNAVYLNQNIAIPTFVSEEGPSTETCSERDVAEGCRICQKMIDGCFGSEECSKEKLRETLENIFQDGQPNGDVGEVDGFFEEYKKYSVEIKRVYRDIDQEIAEATRRNKPLAQTADTLRQETRNRLSWACSLGVRMIHNLNTRRFLESHPR